MDRRSLLKVAGLSSAAIAMARPASADEMPTPTGVFAHGVASGDPLHDRVILWTRISGPKGRDNIEVTWQIAEDAAFRRVVAQGNALASDQRDFCVKVDPEGLAPGQSYYYRFEALGAQSPLGRTRTLPDQGLSPLTLAIASCSNYPAGFFSAYRDIAEREAVDVVLHLGDYIYEYAADGYASQMAQAIDRVSVPAHELVSLDDYRLRHAQYKSDPDLQAMHAAKPMIAVWDDHEVANDAWKGGAENHDPETQGPWEARRSVGFQAYEEWMPVRTPNLVEDGKLFRAFQFGELASLHMLDTRYYDRAEQLNPMAFQDNPQDLERLRRDPSRQMLGQEQFQWLRDGLRQADTRWQLLGQQVMVSELLLPDLSGVLDIPVARERIGDQIVDALLAMGGQGMPIMWDCWDGYAGAREELLAMLDTEASSPVILTGDLHTSIAGDIKRAGQDQAMAVELLTTSISSPGFDDYFPTKTPGQLPPAFRAANPNIQFMDTAKRGWIEVRVTEEAMTSDFRFVDRVDRPNQPSRVAKRLMTSHRSHGDFGLKDASTVSGRT